ncbi:MAG TPA: biopolymer transporter ExbD [Bacteroidales bacterium]|jgi:biopolymer transport protein ExbD|nr:biopolymer transporter ExbD [Bacteroidales bacterium]HQJ81896.1 biopolymer transporter ExbD [Bacteroidales bacterium]
MPKVKLPRSSPRIDMTPMVDTFAVILIFLMLTATMSSPEPATVDTPFSISEKPIPDANYMTFLISTDGKVFMNFDNGPDTLLKFRPRILEEMGKRYGIEFTERQLREFQTYPSSMGVRIEDMTEFLDNQDANARKALQVGIPMDSANNQLAMWIQYARMVNPNIQACIKGDSQVEFPVVKRVLNILQDLNVKRFSLITSLAAVKINLEEIQQ